MSATRGWVLCASDFLQKQRRRWLGTAIMKTCWLVPAALGVALARTVTQLARSPSLAHIRPQVLHTSRRFAAGFGVVHPTATSEVFLSLTGNPFPGRSTSGAVALHMPTPAQPLDASEPGKIVEVIALLKRPGEGSGSANSPHRGQMVVARAPHRVRSITCQQPSPRAAHARWVAPSCPVWPYAEP